MEKLIQPKKTPFSPTGKFMHPSQKGLKARLMQKTLLMVNIGEDDYFSPMKKWLDGRGYFKQTEVVRPLDMQTLFEWHIETNNYDFIFLCTKKSQLVALEFAKIVREFSKNSKVILFFAGTQEEFKQTYTGFEKRYGALYNNSQTDLGYSCLRGLLGRLTQPLVH